MDMLLGPQGRNGEAEEAGYRFVVINGKNKGHGRFNL
jgi:hypothetical protein